MMTTAGWSTDDFKFAMGISTGTPMVFERQRVDKPGFAADFFVEPGTIDHPIRTRIAFYNGAFGRGAKSAGATTAHELAHAWDFNSGFMLSASLAEQTHRSYSYDILKLKREYHPGTSPIGRNPWRQQCILAPGCSTTRVTRRRRPDMFNA
jgi:hypothetical protein